MGNRCAPKRFNSNNDADTFNITNNPMNSVMKSDSSGPDPRIGFRKTR